MSLFARASVPKAVPRSSPTSIGPYKSSESIILRCSHTKGDTSGKLEEMERHRPRSIPIGESLLYSKALCRATQAYQARFFVRLVGTTGQHLQLCNVQRCRANVRTMEPTSPPFRVLQARGSWPTVQLLPIVSPCSLRMTNDITGIESQQFQSALMPDLIQLIPNGSSVQSSTIKSYVSGLLPIC
jgi:hypothetical protein